MYTVSPKYIWKDRVAVNVIKRDEEEIGYYYFCYTNCYWIAYGKGKEGKVWEKGLDAIAYIKGE